MKKRNLLTEQIDPKEWQKKAGILKENVSDSEIEKKADQLKQTTFRPGSLDNDFYNLLKNLKKGRDISQWKSDDAKQIYNMHYKGYTYDNMISLVKKLIDMNVVSDYFSEDYESEFPELK
jgi:hypothetical protein